MLATAAMDPRFWAIADGNHAFETVLVDRGASYRASDLGGSLVRLLRTSSEWSWLPRPH
jgi:hypothetical protein